MVIKMKDTIFGLFNRSRNIIIPIIEPIRIFVLRSAETYAMGPEESANR